MADRDLGVPSALSTALRALAERVSPTRLDRLWIFPPLARGRTESGVIAGSCFAEGERRLLVTLAYRAEETGKGVSFTPVFQEEGEAPEDRLPRIMDGVVRRSPEAQSAPRSVSIAGSHEAFAGLMEEVGPPLDAHGSTGASDLTEQRS
ncbi:MAG: hypothetical protein WD056_00900 [Gemmatimonadota bacterium]